MPPGKMEEKLGTNKDFDETINNKKSNRGGAKGILDNILRKFQTLGFALLMLPLICLFIFCLSASIFPGAVLLLWISKNVAGMGIIPMGLSYATGAGISIILFILTIIFVVPLVNAPLLPFIKPYRGPWFAFESVVWYYHNALLYLVRYTVLDLITPSPLAILFLKMMGMKIGKGALINTSNISDPCLIEVGDYVTIGGSVTMMAHYGMKGYLIIDKLTIGRKTNIGLLANILGGVNIGENVTIAPNAVVLPKSNLENNTKFGFSEK